MAGFEIWTGAPRSGKTYCLVNRVITDFLLNTERVIVTTICFQKGDDDRLSNLIGRLASNSAQRTSFRQRMKLLEDRESEAFDAEGKSLGFHHEQREFWYFTPVNAVVLIDESAGLWGSSAHVSRRPEHFEEVFNLYGQCGWDMYFIVQELSDLDIKVRKKAHFVWVVVNSLMVSAFPGNRVLSSVRSPIQYFQCSMYQRYAYEKREDNAERLDFFRMRPNKRGFANYHSFSQQTARRPWMKPLDDEFMESGTIQRGFSWRRVKLLGRQWFPVFKLFGTLGVIVVIAAIGIKTSLDASKRPIFMSGESESETNVVQVAEDQPVEGRMESETNVVQVAEGQVVEDQSGEVRLVMAASGSAKLSDGRWLKRGVEMPQGTVEAVSRLGVCVKGRWQGWQEVLAELNDEKAGSKSAVGGAIARR